MTTAGESALIAAVALSAARRRSPGQARMRGAHDGEADSGIAASDETARIPERPGH
jgi:hypothetical protein